MKRYTHWLNIEDMAALKKWAEARHIKVSFILRQLTRQLLAGDIELKL